MTSDGVVVIDTPQLPTQGRRDARRGRVARPDPLPHQHRAPRRPHLRQLLVQGRRRGRPPPGRCTTTSWTRTRRSTRSPTRSRRSRPTTPRRAPLIPDRDDYYADPPRGHGRVHRRPDAAGRRPHVPLPVDARPHARASSRSTCPRSASSSPATRSSRGCQTWLMTSNVDQWIEALERIRAARRRPRRARATGRSSRSIVRRHPAGGAARLEGRRRRRGREGLVARGDDRAGPLRRRVRPGRRRAGLHDGSHPEQQRRLALGQAHRDGYAKGR